jgi:hypothetical protein
MTEQFLFEKYRSAGTMSGEDLLLRHADALRFVEDCEDLGLTILGMSFYVREEGHTVEINSTDWSSLTEGPDAFGTSVREARSLIGQGLPHEAEFVSFVVREP